MQKILEQIANVFRLAVRYFKQNPTLYFLVFLNVLGLIFFCYGTVRGSVGLAFLLAEIVLITVTVGFFFIRGVVLEELEQHVTDIEAHPGGIEQLSQDQARLGSAVVQLNEAIGGIGQIKEMLDDFDSYKKGLSAIRQDVASVMTAKDELAAISEDLNEVKGAAQEIAKLRAAVNQYDGLKQAIQEAAAGREALSKAINALKVEVQEVRSLTEAIKETGADGAAGSADVDELRGKLNAIEDEIAQIMDNGLSGFLSVEPEHKLSTVWGSIKSE